MSRAPNVSIPRRQFYLLIVVMVGLLGVGLYNNVHDLTRAFEDPVADGTESGSDAPDDEKPKHVVPESTTLTSGPELLERLQAGGLVIYLRHFQSDHSKWHKDPIHERHGEITLEELVTCENQRSLSEFGRLRAERVGEILKGYEIPIGTIRTSPYCRVTEGIRLMFGRDPDELDINLIYRSGGYSFAEMAKNVLPHLGRVPATGTNDVVMAHRPQMDDIGKIAEGEMYVFEPQGGTRFKLIAKVKDNEWFESLVDPELLGMAGHKGGDYN